VLGLAFKPETDDMREAPAVGIIRSCSKRAQDPRVRSGGKARSDEVLPEIDYADDEYTAVKGADALVFVTEWNQFRALDMIRIRDLMTTPKIADLRNIYEPEDMREFGFEYVGVGR
jgi:UDPglucose 6-dehydrogenase